jgi:hypothetical protein
VPGPLGPDRLMGAQPVPESFDHKMLAQEPIRGKSGTVRIADSSNFPASKTIAAARVELESGPGRANYTGIPIRMSGNTTSKAKDGWVSLPLLVKLVHSTLQQTTSATYRSRWDIMQR